MSKEIRRKNIMRLILSMLIISILGLLPCGAFAQADLLSQTSETMTQQLVAMAEKRGVIAGETLVIAEFDNINCKGDALKRIFQERLITSFIMNEKVFFNVVERTQLDKAMKELKMDISGLTDPDMQKKLGKLLGAKYILLGGISETNGAITFEGRIVAIENGQSKAATRQTITNLNAAPTANTNPAAPAAQNNPLIDTTQNVNPENNGKGTYLAPLENGGLTAGTHFKQEWKERIGLKNTVSFTAADFTGDGKKSIAISSFNSIDGQSRVIHDINLLQWNINKFKATLKKPLSLVSGDSQEKLFINYPRLSTEITENDKKVKQTMLSYGPFRSDKEAGRYSDYGKYSSAIYDKESEEFIIRNNVSAYKMCPNQHWDTTTTLNLTLYEGNQIKVKDKTFDSNIKLYTNAYSYTFGDCDDDGQPEAVITTLKIDEKDKEKKKKVLPGPLMVISTSGQTEFTSEKNYGTAVILWKPNEKSNPFIAVSSCGIDDTGKPEKDAYIYLLQMDEKEGKYVEIWKSGRMGDKVVDLQVCDAKNEGTGGLVALVEDNNNTYFVKFVVE